MEEKSVPIATVICLVSHNFFFGHVYNSYSKLTVSTKRQLLKRKLKWLMWDQVDFKTKDITRDKEGFFVMKKGSVNQEDIKILRVYTLNNKIQNIWREPW